MSFTFGIIALLVNGEPSSIVPASIAATPTAALALNPALAYAQRPALRYNPRRVAWRNLLTEMGMTMKAVLVAVSLAVFSAQGWAASCADTAKEKKLAGAAEKSFMTKCKKDAAASCAAAAQEKKLAGSAQSSFTKKCVADATGS